MLLQKLQEKEQFLTERVTRLKSSIQEAEQNLEPDNIESKAEEVRSLEVQLSLTEKVLQSTQEQLRERIELEGSKQFKAQQKQAQELREQAQNEAVKVFQTLQVLQKQTEEVFNKLNQYESIQRMVTGEVQPYGIRMNQPFAWLGLVAGDINSLLAQTVWLRDKLN